MKKTILTLVLGLSLMVCNAFAAPLSVFDDWTMIGNDDGVYDGGFVDPGWGGQAFDAEYLFVKQAGSVLSIGLQAGFDLVDGKYTSGPRDYYAGDLALSFDGDAGNYEYAFDFGLYTQGYFGVYSGTNAEGFYSVEAWSNDVYFTASNPFAMEAGSLISGAITNDSGLVGDSYYRMVSFDLAGIDLAGLDVHWTMSCGNDVVDGSAPVPEPATMVLLGSGLVGLAFYRRKLKK